MKITKETWKHYLFPVIEIFAIFISILVAFAINQWAEDQSNIRLRNTALENIMDEIGDNYNEVAKIIDAHEKIVTSIGPFVKDEKFNGTFMHVLNEINVPNFSLPALKSTAYDSAVASGATRFMKYKTVSAISELYVLNTVVSNFVGRVLDLMAGPAYYDKEESSKHLAALQFVVSLIYANEKALLERIEEVQDSLGWKMIKDEHSRKDEPREGTNQ